MFRALFLGTVIVVGIAAAPHASADTASYLQILSDNGLKPTDQSQTNQLVQIGNRICQDIHNGTSPNDEATKLASLFKAPQSIAVTVVSAATKQLC